MALMGRVGMPGDAGGEVVVEIVMAGVVWVVLIFLLAPNLLRYSPRSAEAKHLSLLWNSDRAKDDRIHVSEEKKKQ